MKNIILDEIAIKRAISRISNEILERSEEPYNLILLGIVSRGEDIAKRISLKIKEIEDINVPVYAINPINFRDDRENSRELDLSIEIGGKTVILIDDVIYTGRTVRAALDAILSIGRPKAIKLVVLVDRGHRELPIRPDFVGKNLPTARREKVIVEISEVDGQDRVYIES
ncbi:bifunctional pyr operon transcriptional regulator/uracil phosphoribosyltransferase PyrR [Peptoniphilus indolicus]|uniref:Bifunctional protein PyrR n=2 Tax=Peptoniphilus indolicus TaxID=33030 RepID=G4D6R3_9FIRM|nr:bifunctional pyr operon transcriptional regulator/uracil phosphoribosyltransferase PyrR [Peptoniphilus indolicus]EGY76410.1 bifunctional pyrimidine operon attenuation protein/uracil phosphoribosyltransferase [Peptoniphilus indolicus ATCC 29427]SUB76079.1 Bifunctional protein pyrR [Peptoniphilus indolicus]